MKIKMQKQVTLRFMPIILSTVVLFCSIILPAVVYAADPTDAPDYKLQFGDYLSGNNSAYGVAVAPDDTVYVSDNTNDKIVHYTKTGTYIDSFGSTGSGNGQFNEPKGLAITAAGDIFVADSANHRIQKFNSNGVYQSQLATETPGCSSFSPVPSNGTVCYPAGIKIGLNGDIFVADAGNSRVQKFNSSGVYQSQFGTNGSGNGQFNNVTDVAISSTGVIYAADQYNHRVQKFNSSGVYQTQFGTYGSGNGLFIDPVALEFDSSDYLYVVDRGNDRVQKFNTTNTFLAEFGSAGSGNGQFNEANGIAIDSDDDVYVTDTNNTRVQKFHYPVTEVAMANTVNGGDITLETPNGTDVTCSTAVTEASQATQDAGFSYPVGLVDFCLSVSNGSTHVITLTFETSLLPSDVIARKYIANSGTYIPVPGASIAETTLNGQHALQLTYSITDGGALDDDGIVNGEILDPVGLAAAVLLPVVPATNGGGGVSSGEVLANTGSNVTMYLTTGILLVGLASLVIKSKVRMERW